MMDHPKPVVFWNLDIGEGVVVFDDISHLPDAFEAARHIDCLREDMLQIRFGDDVLLDVGWYPSFRKHGHFLLMLVKNQDWEQPLESAKFTDVVTLKQRIAHIASKFASPI